MPLSPHDDRVTIAPHVDGVDVMHAWSHAVRTSLHQVTSCLELLEFEQKIEDLDCTALALESSRELSVTLDHLLHCLDALIGHASRAHLWDLDALANEVARVLSPELQKREISVEFNARGAETLTGRDFRRWKFLLTQTLGQLLRRLPAGSAMAVEIGAVASSRGHRWLQAEVSTTVPENRAPVGEDGSGRADLQVRLGLMAASTALRVMDGACYQESRDLGLTFRLVAPIEG
jgi:hypothetical protein